MTKSGQLPSEALVAGIEARFPNTKTAALARLLRGYILLQTGDFLNAAGLLDTNMIASKSALGDYGLWLRGQALQKAGKKSDAAAVFEKLVANFPTSLRVRDARLNLAQIRSQNGETERALSVLADLLGKNDAAAWLIIAQANENVGRMAEATAAYRKIYFYAPVSPAETEAENSLKRLAFDFNTGTTDENLARANGFYQARKYGEAANLYQSIATISPIALTPQLNLQRGIALANVKRTNDAVVAFNAIPISAGEIKATALAETAETYANARLWAQARQTIEDLRRSFPNNSLTSQTYVSIGMIARDQKNKAEELFYLNTALTTYPNAIEVGKAQFELAWLNHASKNFLASSQQLTEHLARYANKDTTYRGKAGYWAARDSEQAGKLPEACALYEAVLYRYEANWYGYLSNQRLSSLKSNNRCPRANNFSPDSLVGKAAANLKTVTVAPETAGNREAERIIKADELGTISLFDWSLDELNEAAKTAPDSPKVNLGKARLLRKKDDFVGAFLALGKSYPDFSQMKPEEMSREEWDIFYPLNYWDSIKLWAGRRNLDKYQVAGLIRQESVFYPRAKSGANAFGLMQLILPTARTTARKYGSQDVNSIEDLYNPVLNIELGTAYMREQLDKYGRIEYLAVAYNAGPGRVVQWRNSLPIEMDEFVEAIPFKETKAYVQGVIRNSAQYRRLYDENGQFKAIVGTKLLRTEIDSKSREELAQEFPDIILNEQKAEE
ncbi:MAG: transglycosylase SLT domain-containing protein [Pyrinomonadaceae bacterium]